LFLSDLVLLNSVKAMTRRSQSRQQQAFEALLDVEADFAIESARPTRKTRAASGRRTPSSKHIQFRHPEEASSVALRDESRRTGVEVLHELFGSACEREIIDDVYRACGCNVDIATDALLAMNVRDAAETSVTKISAHSRRQGKRNPSYQVALCSGISARNGLCCSEMC
jgi:hypothetical protein